MSEIDELLDRAEAIMGEGPEVGESTAGWAFRASRAEWFMKRAQILMLRQTARMAADLEPQMELNGQVLAGQAEVLAAQRRERSEPPKGDLDAG